MSTQLIVAGSVIVVAVLTALCWAIRGRGRRRRCKLNRDENHCEMRNLTQVTLSNRLATDLGHIGEWSSRFVLEYRRELHRRKCEQALEHCPPRSSIRPHRSYRACLHALPVCDPHVLGRCTRIILDSSTLPVYGIPVERAALTLVAFSPRGGCRRDLFAEN